MNSEQLYERIAALKRERDAVILVHNYQLPEVQAVADYLGDSLDLSRTAASSPHRVIVFCGVRFMAETANLLAPDKVVLLPEPASGCPLADMVTPAGVRALRAAHPDAAVVGYINTPAAVKAELDIVCTSANALQVVESLSQDEVIFVPDKYLGGYVARRTAKRIIPWNGYCPTHMHIRLEDVTAMRRMHPDAPVMVHPECTFDVQDAADVVLGTGGMIAYVRTSSARTFIVGTEVGMCHRLKTLFPDREFVPAATGAVCPNMKRNTLAKVAWSLENLQPRIVVDEALRSRAHAALTRMLAVTER